MPGSVDLHHSESAAVGSIDGNTPAFRTDVIGVDAPADAVMRYFSDELARASWTIDTTDSVGIPTTVETAVQVWRKGDVLFRLSILRKDDPRVPASDRAGEFDTFYEVTLVAKPPGKP